MRSRLPGSAETCREHPGCLRFYRPDGAINEAGWWHASWNVNAWHVVGPDPSEAGFPGLAGRVDVEVIPKPRENPLAALLPFVGHEAVMASLDVILASGPSPGVDAGRPDERELG
jgi:hypothetical protein